MFDINIKQQEKTKVFFRIVVRRITLAECVSHKSVTMYGENNGRPDRVERDSSGKNVVS